MASIGLNSGSLFPPVFRGGRIIADAVQVKLQGKLYEGWQSVSISRAMNALASSFTLEVIDQWRQTDDKFPIMAGQPIQIAIGSQVILNGFIEQMQASVTNTDRNISISGRDRLGDIIDSAAIARSSVYKNKSLKQVADVYCQDFDISVIDLTPQPPIIFAEIVVNQSETVYELLYRYARTMGALLTSNPEGNLVITNKGIGTVDLTGVSLGQDVRSAIGKTAGVFQGKNVISAASNFDETNRFQKYLVKSQIKGSDFVNAKDASTINAVAFDSAVLRQRTKYIISETSSTKKEADKRAKWEANVSAAQSSSATATVQGWFDQNGNLWDVNKLIDTDLRFIGFAKGRYLSTQVTYNQDKNSGTLCDIEFKRQDAFVPEEPEKGKDPKKDAGWDGKVFGESLKDLAKSYGFKV